MEEKRDRTKLGGRERCGGMRRRNNPAKHAGEKFISIFSVQSHV